MFRSKAFTIAFSILSVLIIGLTIIFCYLVFGSGRAALQEALTGTTEAAAEDTGAPANETAPSESIEAAASQDSSESGSSLKEETEEETKKSSETETEEKNSTKETTEESTEKPDESTETEESTAALAEESADQTVRALRADEDHSCPVLLEDIPESGIATIIKSGDNGEGIVFHLSPQFDAADTPGNLTNYSGAFDIGSKIYMLNNGTPFLMYKTIDGYYVTSSANYISYEAKNVTQKPDPVRIGDYGYSEGEEIVVRVFHEDGNTVAFTVYNFSPAAGELLPVLENVIARYDGSGFALFEYHNTDGRAHQGKIGFEKVEGAGYSRRVDVVFDSPVAFRTGERSEIVLHN